MLQCAVGVAIRGPYEFDLVQPACGEPHADAVVHQDLQAVGALVGEQVGMVRLRRLAARL